MQLLGRRINEAGLLSASTTVKTYRCSCSLCGAMVQSKEIQAIADYENC